MAAQPTPDVSPTGQPRVPAAWVPYINLAMGLSIVAGAILGAAPLPPWALAIPGAIFVGGLWLLGNGPGLRKLSVVLLCLAPLAAAGCIHLKPGADKQLVKCGTDAMQSQVAGVMPDVARALQGTAVDWQPQLDQLVARAGSAALCALAVLVANLEVGGGAGAGLIEPAGLKYPDSVLLMRAYAYQAAHPYQLE